MNIPTEFVHVRLAQDITYTLTVSLMPVEVAESISDMSSIVVLSADEPIYRLIHILTDANKIKDVQSIYEQGLVNTNTVMDYLGIRKQ